MAKKSPAVADSTRAKAQAMREAQVRKDRRMRAIIIGVVAVLVVAIVVAVVAVVAQQKNSQSQAQTGTSQSGDVSLLGDYASGQPVLVSHVGVGQKDDSLPTLTEYFDYSCHVCAAVDVAAGPDISQLAVGGSFNIAYQPVTTVGMDYEMPATSASLIVAQKDPSHWLDFHHALLSYFNDQFTSGNGTVIQDSDKSYAQVKTIAQEAGVSQDVIDAFPLDIVTSYLKTTTSAWTSASFEGRDTSSFGTPEFVKDGKTVISLTSTTDKQAILSTITSGMASVSQ